jgi:serine phosphatase RsbU (regulator of sigma subunit)
MSVLGISYLNEIGIKYGALSTGKMLDILNEKILKSLNQDGSQKVLRDGMDISLLRVEKNTRNAQYSAAYNNAYLLYKIDDEINMIDLKADRRPIGLYGKYEEAFNEIKFEIPDSAKIYLASDGLTDQFGGEKHKKFMKKRLRSYLLTIYDYPMYYQKIFLNEKLLSWKGNTEQLDDILVIGIEL